MARSTREQVAVSDRRILGMLNEGKTVPEIARELGMARWGVTLRIRAMKRLYQVLKERRDG
jgi:DNA-binding NarL/FixJ family response regulator